MYNVLQKDVVINNKKYPKNMKVTRVFNKLIKEQYYIFDRIYGNVLNNNFLEGNICFSIHPLDFLTMSDNSCGWQSCHALHGEFRGGLLSLLVDETTAICYFEDANEPTYTIYDVEITNKKWRTLLHIHPDHNLIIFNQAYPHTYNYLLEQGAHKLQKVLNVSTQFEFMKSNECNIIDYITDYEVSFGDPLHYNDLTLRGQQGQYEISEVGVIFDNNLDDNFDDITEAIIIGQPALCPVCGNHYVEHHKSLECEQCDPLEYCCTCAVRFLLEELHDFDSELYCEECFDDTFMYCEYCDDILRKTWESKHQCKEMEEIEFCEIT